MREERRREENTMISLDSNNLTSNLFFENKLNYLLAFYHIFNIKFTKNYFPDLEYVWICFVYLNVL